MSAIVGIVRFDGAPASAAAVERMGNVLAHRGPDRRRYSIFGAVGLGHCLMQVNAEDVHEAQPLWDDAGEVALVADMRLDNRDEVAAETGIGPEALPDLADSALLLAAYRHWGEACVEHLIGDFAFAIWDARSRALLLGRDPMGQRGVFYHHAPGFVAFASEARALWAVEGVPRRLSEEAIGRQLLHPVDPSHGKTLYEGIAHVPGATLIRFGPDGEAVTRIYWTPHAAPEHLGRDEAYYIDAYRTVLEEAVACRVRRLTRPPGLLFSGGFDSGAIAALAGPIVATKGRRVIAVASVLAEDDPRKERDARAAVEAWRDRPFLDVRYHVRGKEGPFTDLTASFLAGGSYRRRGLYGTVAAAGVRLVMDGMGGDTTLHVRAPAMLGRILRRGHVVRFVRELVARRRATARSWRALWLIDTIPALLPHRALVGLHAARRGFRPIWQTRPIRAAFAHALFARGAIDPKRLRQPAVTHLRWRARWLHLLRKAAAGAPAQATLAASQGLEFTRPFHDTRVVELALAIPESLQLKRGVERYLARLALGDRLPRRLLDRPPGNDAEDPDLFRAAREGAAAALAEARTLDRCECLSRYIDFDSVEAMIATADESRPADHARLQVAARAILLARFIAWFDGSNR